MTHQTRKHAMEARHFLQSVEVQGSNKFLRCRECTTAMTIHEYTMTLVYYSNILWQLHIRLKKHQPCFVCFYTGARVTYSSRLLDYGLQEMCHPPYFSDLALERLIMC